jgi:hypothetical protein
MVPYCLVDCYQNFRGTSYFCVQGSLKMEPTGFSKTLVMTYQTT